MGNRGIIKFNETKCNGCTRCMNKCPMEAIRLKNKKPMVISNKCIDCGECIRSCPHSAYEASMDTLKQLESYKINVIIPSVTLNAQFNEYLNPAVLGWALRKLGFDEVFDITYACDIAAEIAAKEIENVSKPPLGVFCPSIEKLIRTYYPSLIDNIVKVITPIEVSAMLIREKYSKKGFNVDDIGIFHITPCVAWKEVVTKQEEGTKRKVHGVIPISEVYAPLLNNIKNIVNNNEVSSDGKDRLSYTGLAWAYPGGISRAIEKSDHISVDGVNNAKKILDEIENGRMDDVGFVELHACSGGCLGGVFTIENAYNGRRITKKYHDIINMTHGVREISDEYRDKFSKVVLNTSYKARLADDFLSALGKMNTMNEIINMLPGIDCGQCGSPSCKAFAEDVVRGFATLSECEKINNKDYKDSEDDENED